MSDTHVDRILRLDREPHKSVATAIKADGSGRDPHRHQRPEDCANGNGASNLHDLLTGLPTAWPLWNGYRKLSRGEASSNLSLSLLDLDDFKDINETLGHSLGDELLKAVAQQLVGTLREDDRIARVGGDEFAVLLSDVSIARRRDARARIISSITAPHLIAAAKCT